MNDGLELGEKVALGGVLVVGVGALLPWTSAAGAASGLDGYGLFTMVFGLIAAVLVGAGGWDRDAHLGVLGLGVLTSLVALVALPPTVASLGAGGYLTVAGGAGLVLGGGLGYAGRLVREQTIEPAD